MKRVETITIWGDPDWIFRHNPKIRYEAEQKGHGRGCQNPSCLHNSHSPYSKVYDLRFPDEEIYFLGREDNEYSQTRWFWLKFQDIVLEFYSHEFHWDSLQIVRGKHEIPNPNRP